MISENPKFVIVKKIDNEVEKIEGLRNIVSYRDLEIFDGDCFMNKNDLSYIEIFLDGYRNGEIYKVENNSLVVDEVNWNKCVSIYRLSTDKNMKKDFTNLKKYFNNMIYIGNVYVDGQGGIVKSYLENGGV